MQREHFDSKNIRQQQTEVEEQYRELQDLASTRRQRLTENKKLFEYLREVEEVRSWTREQETIAASEDYGTDLEHVQVGTDTLHYFKISSTNEPLMVGAILVHVAASQLLGPVCVMKLKISFQKQNFSIGTF